MPQGKSAASGLRVPLLDGIEPSAKTSSDSDLRFRIARAMLEAGVASARTWNGDLDEFISGSISRWVERHGGAAVDRRFDLVATMEVQEHSYRADSKEVVVLGLSPETAGSMHIGPMITWLDAVDPRLPATMLNAINSNYVVRLYDHLDAREYFEMRIDGMDEEDIAGLEIPDRSVPAACGRRPLSAPAIAQRRRRWPSDVRAAVDAMLELKQLSRAFARTQPHLSRAYECYDVGPLPAMVVAFQEHDHVWAAFDDESQHMGTDGNVSPNAGWLIERARASDVRAAFHGMAKALEILASLVRLFDTFPDARRHVIPPERRSGQPAREGRPLAQVLLDDAVYEFDVADDDDEEAA